MMEYAPEPPFDHSAEPSIGVLLANLGTPDEPTPSALRRYLAQFLKDKRVIELPRYQWWPILYGPVLAFRPRRVAELYRSIWTDEGSPLLVIARRQLEGLRERFDERFDAEGRQGPQVHLELGMRYGNPSIASALDRLRNLGCERLLVLPLYPQYSAATTASTLDALAHELLTWRRIPELRTINSYHDDPGYIGALAASIRELWERAGLPDRIVFSYHGMPKRYIEDGDPYHCHCHKTTRLVCERLDCPPELPLTTFQSQFGREEWIKPATDDIVRKLGDAGIERLDVVCPAFSADCLETLEEIEVQNREFFLEHGGKELRYVPALNDREDHLDALAELIERHLQGWWPSAERWAQVRSERALAEERAAKLREDPSSYRPTAVTDS